MKTYLAILFSVFLVSGCATPLTKTERAEINTVGIVNDFPDLPNYMAIGTTIFNNQYGESNAVFLKTFLSNELITLLKEKGFSAVDIQQGDSKNNFDMVIVITPRDVYNLPGTYGYGFYKRSMFGMTAATVSYTAMNLSPEVKGKDRCSACYGESISQLPIAMPENWADLSSEEQAELINLLKSDIRKALRIAFDKTKI